MATHFTADPVNKLLIITTAPTGGELTLDVRKWIYSDLKKDWLNDDSLNKYKFPITPLGGDPLVGSLSVGAFYFLEYGWRIRPYEATHRFILDGNLFTREGDRVDVPTLGNYQVNVDIFNSALVYQVGASADDIASAVWDALTANHVLVDSFGEVVAAGGSSGTNPADVTYEVVPPPALEPVLPDDALVLELPPASSTGYEVIQPSVLIQLPDDITIDWSC